MTIFSVHLAGQHTVTTNYGLPIYHLSSCCYNIHYTAGTLRTCIKSRGQNENSMWEKKNSMGEAKLSAGLM